MLFGPLGKRERGGGIESRRVAVWPCRLYRGLFEVGKTAFSFDVEVVASDELFGGGGRVLQGRGTESTV